MFKDTPDGRTNYCTHTDDDSLCERCLGKPTPACLCYGPRGENESLCDECKKDKHRGRKMYELGRYQVIMDLLAMGDVRVRVEDIKKYAKDNGIKI